MPPHHHTESMQVASLLPPHTLDPFIFLDSDSPNASGLPNMPKGYVQGDSMPLAPHICCPPQQYI